MISVEGERLPSQTRRVLEGSQGGYPLNSEQLEQQSFEPLVLQSPYRGYVLLLGECPPLQGYPNDDVRPMLKKAKPPMFSAC